MILNEGWLMPVKVLCNWVPQVSQWFKWLLPTGVYWTLVSLLINSTAYSRDDMDWRRQKFCGINSTYMFLRLHGEEYEYETLMDELKPTNGSLSLLNLKESISQRGISCSIYSATPQDLKLIPVPYIAHIEFESDRIIDYDKRGHFVLVFEVKNDSIRYLDGTTAAIHTVDIPVFERMWSSHVLVRDEPVLLKSNFFLITPVVILGGYFLVWRMRIK